MSTISTHTNTCTQTAAELSCALLALSTLQLLSLSSTLLNSHFLLLLLLGTESKTVMEISFTSSYFEEKQV